MRAYIAQLIATDPTLLAQGLPVGAVYSAENVDTPGAKPFIVIRWLDRPPSIRRAPSQTNPFEVWVYDQRGDYSRIDLFIKRIRDVLTAVTAQQTETGWVTQVDWAGDGRDSYDDVWEAISRTSTYQAVASYT